jgi:hypothetical protein
MAAALTRKASFENSLDQLEHQQAPVKQTIPLAKKKYAEPEDMVKPAEVYKNCKVAVKLLVDPKSDAQWAERTLKKAYPLMQPSQIALVNGIIKNRRNVNEQA